ncbi:superoxide dismutase family protein [Streptomyces sp. NPDC048191]|uniref:superoxide dismutase family protein n=1 Tax=Streptomyces sp. NPDC048191 TaxID=3155484 RepID=UPI0033FF2941
MRHSVAALTGAMVMTGGLVACSSGSSVSGAGTPTATASSGISAALLASATFAAPAASGKQPAGVTYNTGLVPTGAKVTIKSEAKGGGREISLTVSGLRPNRRYGSHVHTKACGAQPADAGPHYQDKKDPVQPSVDPAYANKNNEVWLDFITNAKGEATMTSHVKWAFREGQANSVVIHVDHTSTHAGMAGMAGERLACLTARFS